MKKIVPVLILLIVFLLLVVIIQFMDINTLSNRIYLNADEIDMQAKFNKRTNRKEFLTQGVPIPYTTAESAIYNYLSSNANATIFGNKKQWKQLRSFWMPINVFTDYLNFSQPNSVTYTGSIAFFKLFLAKDSNNQGVSLVIIPYDSTGKYMTLPGNMVYNQIAGCPAVCPEEIFNTISAPIDTFDMHYDPNTNPVFYAQYDNLIDQNSDGGQIWTPLPITLVYEVILSQRY